MGPYATRSDGAITYRGNKLFSPLSDVRGCRPSPSEFQYRARVLGESGTWSALARINHRISLSTHQFFDERGALFTLLPLTTRMISSPGAVYGREAIRFTTDTSPITLRWFDCPETIFLAESSQIYLELALLQPGVDEVYCIYNSFRKETADATHLPEFHHIEYEGKVGQAENEVIALKLVERILADLLAHCERDLYCFLDSEQIVSLDALRSRLFDTARISFAEALQLLREDTGNPRYEKFTMDGTFGSWEEVRLTEILGGPVLVKHFPLLEVPFYHATVEGSNPAVADNADFIWPGYREILGSGARITSSAGLEEKATIFSLPLDDYQVYLESRAVEAYARSSGFGLGWERLLQGLLEMPFIWSASHFPRVDGTMRP